MPNNSDIFAGLTEDMVLEHTRRDGRRLYTLPVRSRMAANGEPTSDYLYRSMSMEEARNWFSTGWLPDKSGIPWSTNWSYSRENYLKGNSTVQLEVPAADILPRMAAVGASPKYEGNGATWGVGPKAEIGRKPGRDQNDALQALHAEWKDRIADTTIANLPAGKIANASNHKTVQNTLFATMFKDKIVQARVVARVL